MERRGIMTNKELAKILDVSEATVSLVLNGKSGISDKTRKSVIARIKELGYQDMLKECTEGPVIQTSQKSAQNIGFILYKDGGQLLGMNSFFPLIFDGIESTARKYNYTLSVINIEKEQLKTQIQYIRDADCRGFVVFATEMQEPEVACFEELQIPFVIFDNYFIDHEINSVKVNNEQGTYLAVKYLHRLGHRKVGYLSSGLAINSFCEREMCAKKAIREIGMEEPDPYSFVLGYPTDNAELQMEELLDKNVELPTAFLADNDLVAIGAMQALKKRGYKIPEEISVIGYDDRPICELVEPTLTTIRLPREHFGAEAVERLIALMHQERSETVKLEINGTLVARHSTATVAR